MGETPHFLHLVRFADEQGDEFYGELGRDFDWKADLIGLSVRVYQDDLPWDETSQLTQTMKRISNVLCPLSTTPNFQCVGVNYKSHIAETKLPTPGYPVIFTKPADALAGPFEDITINKECKLMDYEAELCVIIGRTCKDIKTREEAESCVFGYTAGNDISSRFWQMPEQCGGQFGLAKSFDKFGPIGPTVLHPSLVSKQEGLRIRTLVNGDIRQDAVTNDLVFDALDIIIHLTRGATLRRGTVIMTGTPGGVAAFMKPPQWLQNGDVVQIEIEKIGTMANRMVMEA